MQIGLRHPKSRIGTTEEAIGKEVQEHPPPVSGIFMTPPATMIRKWGQPNCRSMRKWDLIHCLVWVNRTWFVKILRKNTQIC